PLVPNRHRSPIPGRGVGARGADPRHRPAGGPGGPAGPGGVPPGAPLPLDPVEAARQWVAAGAQRLHLVDLDGARSGAAPGATPNGQAVARVCQAVAVPVQLGGGIRSLEAAQAALALGVEGVILGTVVVRAPERAARILEALGGRAWVSLDLREGRLAVAGWEEEGEQDGLAIARWAREAGAGGLVVTAVGRDGTLAG